MNILLEEAKQELQENLHEGTECPCCGQFAKLYKRKFNSTMARCLIKLYGMEDKFHHVSQIIEGISPTGSGDFSKLRYWGAIEEMPNDNRTKKTSGYWRITEAGRDIVQNPLKKLEGYALVYNSEALKMEGETTLVDALGEKFDYQELMNS